MNLLEAFTIIIAQHEPDFDYTLECSCGWTRTIYDPNWSDHIKIELENAAKDDE